MQWQGAENASTIVQQVLDRSFTSAESLQGFHKRMSVCKRLTPQLLFRCVSYVLLISVYIGLKELILPH